MKELLIRVKINNKKKDIMTIIQKAGFDESITDSLIMIGVLENLKSNEQEKLKCIEHSTDSKSFLKGSKGYS